MPVLTRGSKQSSYAKDQLKSRPKLQVLFLLSVNKLINITELSSSISLTQDIYPTYVSFVTLLVLLSIYCTLGYGVQDGCLAFLLLVAASIPMQCMGAITLCI